SVYFLDVGQREDLAAAAEEGDSLVKRIGNRFAVGETAGDRRGLGRADLEHQRVAARRRRLQQDRGVGLAGETDVDIEGARILPCAGHVVDPGGRLRDAVRACRLSQRLPGGGGRRLRRLRRGRRAGRDGKGGKASCKSVSDQGPLPIG